jgi:hypothetical protein
MAGQKTMKPSRKEARINDPACRKRGKTPEPAPTPAPQMVA